MVHTTGSADPLFSRVIDTSVQVEARKETFVVVQDPSRWVLVRVQPLPASRPGEEPVSLVTLTDQNGLQQSSTASWGEEWVVLSDPGKPPFTVRVEGPGLQPFERPDVGLLETVHAAMEGIAAAEFVARDPATRKALNHAEVQLYWPGYLRSGLSDWETRRRLHGRWTPLAHGKFSLRSGRYVHPSAQALRWPHTQVRRVVHWSRCRQPHRAGGRGARALAASSEGPKQRRYRRPQRGDPARRLGTRGRDVRIHAPPGPGGRA